MDTPKAQKVWVDEVIINNFGPISIAMTQDGLIAVSIKQSLSEFVIAMKGIVQEDIIIEKERTATLTQQIREYFDGSRREFEVVIPWRIFPLFQQEVLKIVMTIPYGEVRTYGNIARQLGKPGAGQAVGNANAHNPIPLIIPCHRVIGTDGRLHGYSAPGGLETKAWLLKLERKYGKNTYDSLPLFKNS